MALEATPGALDGVAGGVGNRGAFGPTEPPMDQRPVGNQHEPGGIC
jgi:hypothetical protein